MREHLAQIDYNLLKNKNEELIINYLIEMRNKGRTKSTLQSVSQRFKQLAKNCDISNPNEVREYIAKKESWNLNTKKTVVIYLIGFYKWLNINWNPPRYRPFKKTPFIPTEEELTALIGSLPKFYATLCQFLKETGVRIGEALILKWVDLDLERRTASITPEKYSNPRIQPLSFNLANMLNRIPRKSEYVFYKTYKTMRNCFRYHRNKTAIKLQNPRIKEIHFHTFRHYYATMLYHKTRLLITVQQALGHKDIKTTAQYINIEASIFKYSSDEWIVQRPQTKKEEDKLISLGFEYVRFDERHNEPIYKKRK